MNRGWKSSEACSRKSLHCYEWSFKSNSGEDSEDKEQSCRGSLSLLKEYIRGHEQNVSRNMDGNGHFDVVSD